MRNDSIRQEGEQAVVAAHEVCHIQNKTAEQEVKDADAPPSECALHGASAGGGEKPAPMKECHAERRQPAEQEAGKDDSGGIG